MKDWRDQVRIDGVVPADGRNLIDILAEVSKRMPRYGVGPVMADVRALQNAQRGEIERFGRWEVVWGASEVRWVGVDMGREPAVAVEGVWHDGDMVEVREEPRRRREPFPNPEAAKWRPKV